MKVMLCKTLSGTILPAADHDKEILKRFKAGDIFCADVTKPRNLKFHRKFFSLLNLVLENQEIYQHLNDLRRDITIEAGYFYHRTTMLGEVVKEPESISFAAMDDLQFSEFYGKCIDVIVKHFSFDKQSLIDEIEQYFV